MPGGKKAVELNWKKKRLAWPSKRNKWREVLGIRQAVIVLSCPIALAMRLLGISGKMTRVETVDQSSDLNVCYVSKGVSISHKLFLKKLKTP